jgi:hypothetical protein
MVDIIEKLIEINAAYIIATGVIISALLFKLLFDFAEEGNAVLVILLGLAIGTVGFLITKILAYQRQYRQLKEL